MYSNVDTFISTLIDSLYRMSANMEVERDSYSKRTKKYNFLDGYVDCLYSLINQFKDIQNFSSDDQNYSSHDQNNSSGFGDEYYGCGFYIEFYNKLKSELSQAYFSTCFEDRFYHIECADELVKLQRSQCELCDFVDCPQKKI